MTNQQNWVQPKEEDLTGIVRVSFTIDRSLYERMQSIVPWGVRSHFFAKILEMALDRIAEGGYEVIAAVLAGDYDPLRGGENDV